MCYTSSEIVSTFFNSLLLKNIFYIKPIRIVSLLSLFQILQLQTTEVTILYSL